MPLAAGTRLGPYEIVAPLGAGGMGEVYRARDTRLDRTVAVKILPAGLAADPQFRERFDREARAISQLTHPHICTLYDVGEHEGTAFLVMQLLEGETLEARLEKGALPPDQALAIAIQIADALASAHRAGIVHRDLKPGNIFLTKGGAKLLDFGLAKTSTPVVATSGLSMMPTTPPAAMTAAGTILGTFQYMAPEQIEGMEADARTDLFAFGCVLFEMLTGRKAFEGTTRASLLGAILKDEPPPVSQVQPVTPVALDRIVQTCLAKDPDERWQTARDLLRELKWVAANLANPAKQTNLENPANLAKRATLANPANLALLLAVAVITGTAVWALTRPAPVSRPVVRLQATPPTTTPLTIDGFAPDIALSPDGTHLVYAGGRTQVQLFVRAMAQGDEILLAGTINARGPFFSPDGEWIGYFDQNASDLKKVSVHGGPPFTICANCGGGNRGATWGADDTIIFSAAGGSGLRRVPAGGGDPVTLTTPDSRNGETGHTWPEFLPGGQAILFTISTSGGIENAMIASLDLKTGAKTIQLRGGTAPHFVATGHVVYAVNGTLRAVAFDPSRVTVTGNAVSVLERVVTKAQGAADFSVSRDGTLAYLSGSAAQGGTQSLAWIDRQGHEERIPAPARNYLFPRLSPDGQRVALDVRDSQNDIWIWDFTRRVMTRLTTDPSLDQFPVWSRDGHRIAFASTRAGSNANIFWQAVDGTGTAERLTTSSMVQYPWAFTPDGKSLVIRDTDPKTGPDISVISIDGDHTPRPLIHSAFNEQNAELSQDGRWIAYQSNESGRDEVYVRPFPAIESGHWQITTEGGSRPLWARNGRELFFVDINSRIMTVPIQTTPVFVHGGPGVAVESGGFLAAVGRSYDVSPDGRKFLMVKSAPRDESNPTLLNVVLNWGEELKRLAPVKR